MAPPTMRKSGTIVPRYTMRVRVLNFARVAIAQKKHRHRAQGQWSPASAGDEPREPTQSQLQRSVGVRALN